MGLALVRRNIPERLPRTEVAAPPGRLKRNRGKGCQTLPVRIAG
jgi:hypothetical protein